jgi:hypothetical protein
MPKRTSSSPCSFCSPTVCRKAKLALRIETRRLPGAGGQDRGGSPTPLTKRQGLQRAIAEDGESARPFQEFIVLVVEDEDPLRQAVVKMLRNAGFRGTGGSRRGGYPIQPALLLTQRLGLPRPRKRQRLP